MPITGAGTFGNYASTPIVLDGVVFTQDLTSNVKAIDLESGEVLWEKKYDSPSTGPNGVAVADGRVYGATQDSAFALDAASGDELWKVKLTRNKKEGIDMAPGVNGDLVYVSTVPGNPDGFYTGNGQGVVHALNAETGEKAWQFETVPEDLWGNKEVNSGGGLWHAPAFDDTGAMYFSVANPAPFLGTKELPWATSRPGDNEHTNSLVKLDAATGAENWINQVLPHDLYDWDLHLSPVLADPSDGQSLVVTGGKMGYVYAVDRETGELVWKTAVGQHNGHDEDNQLALAGKLDQLPKLPLTLLPGILGGVETQMAVSGDTVFAPIVNMPTVFKSQTERELKIDQGTGAMWALDLATGAVKWKHPFDTPAYGAATVVNDLVFTTTFDGKVTALSTETGDEVWSQQLPAGTNATVAVAGDWLITAASFPQGADQKPVIIAYSLGGGDEGTDTGATDTGATDTGATDTGATDTGATDTGATDTGATDTGATDTSGGESTAATADGAALFSANCASCHTLAAADSSGNVGPNLDQLDIPLDAIVDQITNGGGGMPAFGGQLSEDEIQAIAQYVVDNRDPNAQDTGGGGGP